MLQAFAEKCRRWIRALVLPVAVLALMFAAPTGAFAAGIDIQFIEAAESGDTAEVERLLAGGADVDHRIADGATALIMASQNGHSAAIEVLLAKGAALDVQRKDGATALFMASQKGHGTIIDALLAKGANTELQIKDGRTAQDFAKNATIENMLRAAAKP